jgi:hypothetical protein
MQKPFQFCIPALKTPQPVMPYCISMIKLTLNSIIDSIEGSAMETWLNPSTNQINPVNDFKNNTDTTQASSYSSISRMELKTGIGSTLQPLSKTVSSTVAGT